MWVCSISLGFLSDMGGPAIEDCSLDHHHLTAGLDRHRCNSYDQAWGPRSMGSGHQSDGARDAEGRRPYFDALFPGRQFSSTVADNEQNAEARAAQKNRVKAKGARTRNPSAGWLRRTVLRLSQLNKNNARLNPTTPQARSDTIETHGSKSAISPIANP